MMHVDNNSSIDPASSPVDIHSGGPPPLSSASCLAERLLEAHCANEELIYERHGRLGGPERSTSSAPESLKSDFGFNLPPFLPPAAPPPLVPPPPTPPGAGAAPALHPQPQQPCKTANICACVLLTLTPTWQIYRRDANGRKNKHCKTFRVVRGFGRLAA